MSTREPHPAFTSIPRLYDKGRMWRFQWLARLGEIQDSCSNQERESRESEVTWEVFCAARSGPVTVQRPEAHRGANMESNACDDERKDAAGVRVGWRQVESDADFRGVPMRLRCASLVRRSSTCRSRIELQDVGPDRAEDGIESRSSLLWWCGTRLIVRSVWR